MEQDTLIGIDFGTVNTSVCVTRYNASLAQQFETPTPVLLGKQREPVLRSLLMLDAAAGMALGIGQEIYHTGDLGEQFADFIQAGFKTRLGEDATADLCTRHFLAYLAEAVKVDFNTAALEPERYLTTIGAPAEWFEDRAGRVRALRHIALSAGFPNVNVIAEPVACVYHHVFRGDIKLTDGPQNWLVLDVGGSAARVARVETAPKMSPRCTPLFSRAIGGQHYDELLLNEWLLPRYWTESLPSLWQQWQLLEFVREFKEAFSHRVRNGETMHRQNSDLDGLRNPVVLDRAEFEALVKPLLDEMQSLWREIPTDADGLLVTGGGAHWYFVRDEAQQFFQDSGYVLADSPDLTLAQGLALVRAPFKLPVPPPPQPQADPMPFLTRTEEIVVDVPPEPEIDPYAEEYAGYRAQARKIAKKRAAWGGLLALAVSPIPGVSQPFLTYIEIKLIIDIAKIYGFKLKFEDIVGTLLALFVLGSLVKLAVMELATAVPFAGWAFKGGVAAAAIYGWGELANRHFEAQRRKNMQAPTQLVEGAK
ncbi:MAG: DUF697 domain-containing protein [Anaerolineae bacterium]|nr:DUF697 domain-containing protein [Anaerolineae bacterium]